MTTAISSKAQKITDGQTYINDFCSMTGISSDQVSKWQTRKSHFPRSVTDSRTDRQTDRQCEL